MGKAEKSATFNDSVRVQCNNENCEMDTYKTNAKDTIRCIQCRSRDIEILETGLSITHTWEEHTDND